MELTHFNEEGRARMVDVSAKPETEREAVAHGVVRMQPETFTLIANKEIAKGDVLAVAQVAGIMAAKQTWQLIPMCHPLLLTKVDISFTMDGEHHVIGITARVKTTGKTGVEMEALTAVAVAGLTIYDMCKAVDRTMTLGELCLVSKTGGKSGTFVREGSMRGKVVAVCTSPQKGMRKRNVGRGTLKPEWGLEGDAHGGNWHRQVSLLALESIEKMRAKGLDVNPGDFAENITTAGIDLLAMPVGTKFKLGEAVLEVTQIGKECHNRCAIYYQAGDCVMPREGIFARVLKEGSVQIGDPLEVIEG